MALTQSARIPGLGPSWDEEVVPALRKRLESESRTLARRISAVSVSSVEDLPDDTAYRGTTATSPTFSIQSSATYTRPTNGRNASDRSVNTARLNGNVNNSSSKPPPSSRPRTYSQPHAPALNGSASGSSRTKASDSLSISSSNRPVSPAQTNAKPSRIPQPTTRNRADSMSSHTHSIASLSVNGHNGSAYGSPRAPTPGAAEMGSPSELWVVHEKTSATASRSTVSVSSHQQQPGLLNEPAPFKPGSAASSNMYSSKESFQPNHDDFDDAPPRPSMDSEERPFEHWYRGEVSRNGGVGEYRVAKRQEMLEIATYGHTLKQPAVRNAITDAIDERRRMRRRADSTGVMPERASFYMDEEKAKEIARVMDEGPLTDMDGETSDHDADNSSAYYDPIEHMNSADADMSSHSAPFSSTSVHDPRSTTPTPSSIQRPSSRTQNSTSRIPRSNTPTQQFQRGLSEPPSLPSTSNPLPSTPKASRIRTQQATQMKSTPSSSSTSTPQSQQKRERATSPSSPGSVQDSNKKSRLAASKATQAKLAKKKEMENDTSRRSVAYYPEPGDNMMDAIPTWTQPVPKAGNWDDVVLPVVARKKGLDGLYEQADGSPRARRADDPVAPAPGTFGFDHSKYRPPREGEDGDSIPMDEFGQPVVREDQEEEERTPTQPSFHPISTSPHDETRLPAGSALQPSRSSVPFVQYAPNGVGPEPVSVPMVMMNGDLERGRQKEEEEDAGGCCKCIVM